MPIDLDFMKNLWIPNVFVYNLNSFKALDCLKKLAGLWIVKDKDLFYNQVCSKNLIYRLRPHFVFKTFWDWILHFEKPEYQVLVLEYKNIRKNNGEF